MNKKNKSEILSPLVYILSLAFIVRIAVPLIVILTTGDYSLFYTPDTFTYIRPAEELLSHGRFYSNGLPELFRTPGYPLFLIPGILLGKVETITITLQIILNCLTTYLVFRVALTLFEDARIAAWGAFLYAVEPVSILYASKLLSETLCTFLTILFVYCLLKYFKTESLKILLLASLLLSISVYVRPAGYFLPIVIVVVLLAWSLKKRKAVLFAHTLSFLLCSFLIIGLWQLRNERETGYSGFSSVSDYNLYGYQAASVRAIQERVPYYEMQRSMGCPDKKIYLQNHPEQSYWDRGKIYHSMGREGLKIITREPVTYLLIHAKGIVRTLIDPGITEYLIMFKRHSWSGGLLGQALDQGLFVTFKDFARTMPIFFFGLLTLLGLYLVVSFGSAVVALFHKAFPYGISTVAILCILGYYLLVSGGPVGYHRFRLPIMPLVCVFSCYGLYLLQGRLRRQESGNLVS
jgi:4-amino-4-deoxy-L-arabinose transferase-like glycosyltransferase